MSVLSAQIDELRNAARGQKAMGLFELAQMLNDAADTIWQLRDDLQRANAENAKLRELVSVMPRCWNADCDGCPMAVGKTVYGYGAERCIAEDKLRELGVEVD